MQKVALILLIILGVSGCKSSGEKAEANACKKVPNADNTPINCGKCADYTPECGWCFESKETPDPFKGTCVHEMDVERECASGLWVRSGDRCDQPAEVAK